MPLSAPPLKDGRVEPHDHPDIQAADEIIRRISELQVVEVDGVKRVSSIAFQPSREVRGGLSIDIRKSMDCSGIDAVEFVTTPRWVGSVIFTAAAPRSMALFVGYEPIPDNVHHGEVWPGAESFSKKKSKELQRLARWFVPIPNVTLV